MRPEQYSADRIEALLRRKTIATMPELAATLGTSVERTVFRKLAELRCRSSYSHRGRYYALDEVARFDAMGLWSCRSVWFSLRGSLVETAAALVDTSSAGYFADELDDALHVQTKDCLRKLVAARRLASDASSGRLLYCSVNANTRAAQLVARREQRGAAAPAPAADDELKATIILFLGLLDEKQRRLFAGLESLRLGRGGDALVGATLGVDPSTVAKGRRELLGSEIDQARVRGTGAGRKAVEKKRPRSSAASRKS